MAPSLARYPELPTRSADAPQLGRLVAVPTSISASNDIDKMPIENVPLVQHAIQLAIAPVFLLTGIAGLLGVMANRLARIIDRARDLEQRWPGLDDKVRATIRLEFSNLERRRRLASWAINFCTGAALLVCVVIMTLFVEEFVRADLRWLAGTEFVVAMICLIGGLSCFLREVYIATHTVRIADHNGHK